MISLMVHSGASKEIWWYLGSFDYPMHFLFRIANNLFLIIFTGLNNLKNINGQDKKVSSIISEKVVYFTNLS